MGKFTEVVANSGMSIDTQKLFQPSYVIPIPYTLHYEGRYLSGKSCTEKTITVEQALYAEMAVISEAKNLGIERQGERKKKALQRFLGEAFDVLWEAFQTDTQETHTRL